MMPPPMPDAPSTLLRIPPPMPPRCHPAEAVTRARRMTPPPLTSIFSTHLTSNCAASFAKNAFA